jgi:hypothetical protein
MGWLIIIIFYSRISSSIVDNYALILYFPREKSSVKTHLTKDLMGIMLTVVAHIPAETVLKQA